MRIALLMSNIALLVLIAAACGGGSANGTEYRVVIHFNETVTQADDETAEILGAYDDDLEYLVQESFPPTGVARLRTDAVDFCETVEFQLEAKSYVSDVECSVYEEPPASASPEEPVSSEPGGGPGGGPVY